MCVSVCVCESVCVCVHMRCVQKYVGGCGDVRLWVYLCVCVGVCVGVWVCVGGGGWVRTNHICMPCNMSATCTIVCMRAEFECVCVCVCVRESVCMCVCEVMRFEPVQLNLSTCVVQSFACVPSACV